MILLWIANRTILQNHKMFDLIWVLRVSEIKKIINDIEYKY